MGVAQGDFDRDGHIDYFVTNVGADALPVFNPYHISGSWALDNGTPFHRLLKNDGRGRLVDVAAEIEVVPSEVLPPRNRLAGRGLAGFEFGFGCAFFDMDNDGWLDLHWIGDITPGPPSVLRPDYHGVGRFLSNNGGTTFTDRTAERGLFHFLPDDPMRYGFNQPGRALAAVDLTGDGFVDVTRTTTKGLDGPEYGFSCLVNPGLEEGHWIVVRLTGTASNRFGIGARVEATTSGQIFVGEVITTTSAFTAVHPQVHFGLGPATTIEMLTVRWPSGAVTELRDVAADRILTVSESSSE
jgi:hypothetical protein